MLEQEWSVERWMAENREAVELALRPLSGDRLLVPERAFLAYALVEFDAALVDGEAVVGGERSGQ